MILGQIQVRPAAVRSICQQASLFLVLLVITNSLSIVQENAAQFSHSWSVLVISMSDDSWLAFASLHDHPSIVNVMSAWLSLFASRSTAC